MKKAFLLIIAAVLCGCVGFWLQSRKAAAFSRIDDAHIYFFYQERCPHCHHARDYIKEKYPTLQMKNLDISVKENQDDFLECAEKFNLPKDQLGTPLICMGKNVILGWSEREQNNFDKYVKPFLK